MSESNTPPLKEKRIKKIWPLIQRLFRKWMPGFDLHRDDLVEGLTTEDNSHADSFDEEEKHLLKNILTLNQRRVEDVMVRRAQIHAIDIASSFDDVCKSFEATNHSRLPIYRDTLDQPIGILHIKDVFSHRMQKNKKFRLEKIVHRPLFVPPSMKVIDLLRKMQEQKLHMALVIDEHGGTSGLVSIEDLVEEIVGEIEDEHEQEKDAKHNLIKRQDGSLEVNALTPLSELEEVLGENISQDYPNAQTLNGLAIALSGHLPQKGERIITPSNMVIEIRAADKRRVRLVRIYHADQKTSAPSPPAPKAKKIAKA